MQISGIVTNDNCKNMNFKGIVGKELIEKINFDKFSECSRELKKTGKENLLLKSNMWNNLKNFKSSLKKHFTGYPKRINYTAQHKKAFLKVEKELLGKNTLSGYLHDTDKLLMYILGFPKKLAHNIHIATAPHHLHNGKFRKPIQTIIDWESAHLTKSDKPLNAKEFYEQYYVKYRNERYPEIEEAFKKLSIDQ